MRQHCYTATSHYYSLHCYYYMIKKTVMIIIFLFTLLITFPVSIRIYDVISVVSMVHLYVFFSCFIFIF